ncbi:hypothetical protein HanPI659440_Chr13g0485091 [Helianthus annuus]|nr:hypothetical protein HanPI659440_Chr13g0485091 [Helianthus annuus]
MSESDQQGPEMEQWRPMVAAYKNEPPTDAKMVGWRPKFQSGQSLFPKMSLLQFQCDGGQSLFPNMNKCTERVNAHVEDILEFDDIAPSPPAEEKGSSAKPNDLEELVEEPVESIIFITRDQVQEPLYVKRKVINARDLVQEPLYVKREVINAVEGKVFNILKILFGNFQSVLGYIFIYFNLVISWPLEELLLVLFYIV